jgi:hypothetical protein
MSNNPKSASNRLAALWKEAPKKIEQSAEGSRPSQQSSVIPDADPRTNESAKEESISEPSAKSSDNRTVPIQRPQKSSRPSQLSVASGQRPSSGPGIEKVEHRESSEIDTGFREFESRWSPVLRQGQMKVCEAIYKNTISLERTEYDTNLPRLSTEVGLKVRQVRNILSQLTLMGFIEREEITQNQRSLGTRIRFFPDPRK